MDDDRADCVEAGTGVLDPQRFERDALLEQLEWAQQAKARAEAAEAQALAALAAWRPTNFDEHEPAHRRWARDAFIRDEVACVLRCAPVTAAGRMAQASLLVDGLPETFADLEAGLITPGHARAATDAALLLEPEQRAEFETRVLRDVEDTSVSEFRARCRTTAIAVDPAGAQRRHSEAKKQRRVEFWDDADGMGGLYAYLTAGELARIRQHVNLCADIAEATAGVDRGRDQVRADVLIDLLTGDVTTCQHGPTSAGRARPITVVVPLRALDGTDEQGCEIDGQPVPAAAARELANDPSAWWRPVLVDRDGRVEAVGARTYKPGAQLRRLVHLHDRQCQFPGCRRRAEFTELDHAVRFDHDDPTAGGLTVFANLHCLCNRHHRLKHEAGWAVRRTDGVTTWRSPTNRIFRKAVEPLLEPEHEKAPSAGSGKPVDDPPPF